ncbi:Protein of unknown function DUF3716 [Penicillium italicum]|uniref:Uncharacterized protein n=1 Tax=Penicillium italicum TaxID=40296 RepID=A0A0A2LBT3_PENIT|nr:Protein of unknown function DUF3716 [Penicillium italicum]
MEETNQNSRPEARPAVRRTVLPPPPAQGYGMAAPGPWAVHIHKLPFREARQGDILQGRYLDALNAMPNQREPHLRYGTNWTAQRFQQEMNSSLPRVEAALMQVVGQQNEVNCTRCLKLFGKFSRCVTVRGIDGLSACANCHWEEQDNLCQHAQEFATFSRTRARQVPIDIGHFHASTTFPQPPAGNPSSSRSHARNTDDGTAGGAGIRRSHSREFISLLAAQTRLLSLSDSIEVQMEALENQLAAANIAPTTTGQPLQQIVSDIRAAQEELDDGIWRNVYNSVQMMRPNRGTSS